MEKKFSIRGYTEKANAPIFYDHQVYSFDEARVKALEHLHKSEVISKIVIFDIEKGEEKGTKMFIFRNEEGDIEEVNLEEEG